MSHKCVGEARESAADMIVEICSTLPDESGALAHRAATRYRAPRQALPATGFAD